MFVLGFCAVMDLPREMRPQALLHCSPQILPALLVLFSGLKRAYECECVFRVHSHCVFLFLPHRVKLLKCECSWKEAHALSLTCYCLARGEEEDDEDDEDGETDEGEFCSTATFFLNDNNNNSSNNNGLFFTLWCLSTSIKNYCVVCCVC